MDRLWPRGFTKESANIDQWLREVAPSMELRKWYAHDPTKWDEFRRRYLEELKGKEPVLEGLRSRAMKGTVTLLYSKKDVEHNQAIVLKEFLEKS